MTYSSVSELRKEFEERRRRLNFFDANAWVGLSPDPTFIRIEDKDELLKSLDAAMITSALVTHTTSLYYNFDESNRETEKIISDSRRLFGAVTLVPDGTVEVGSISEYLDRFLKKNFRAGRAFPRTHNFSLEDWSAGSTFIALQERRMPLIIWHTETSWSEIHRICEQYPDLPVVVEGTPLKILYDNRYYYPLLNIHRNLFLEIHNLVNYLLVEDIVKRFGPQKLIYGSYLPFQEPTVPMMLVTHARITEEDKRLIAGDNLRALLKAVRT